MAIATTLEHNDIQLMSLNCDSEPNNSFAIPLLSGLPRGLADMLEQIVFDIRDVAILSVVLPSGSICAWISSVVLGDVHFVYIDVGIKIFRDDMCAILCADVFTASAGPRPEGVEACSPGSGTPMP